MYNSTIYPAGTGVRYIGSMPHRMQRDYPFITPQIQANPVLTISEHDTDNTLLIKEICKGQAQPWLSCNDFVLANQFVSGDRVKLVDNMAIECLKPFIGHVLTVSNVRYNEDDILEWITFNEVDVSDYNLFTDDMFMLINPYDCPANYDALYAEAAYWG